MLVFKHCFLHITFKSNFFSIWKVSLCCCTERLFSSKTESEKKTDLKMSATNLRYFENKYPNYDVNIDCYDNNAKIKSNILECVSKIESSLPKESKYGDGGLYVGMAGIAYMFLHLSRSKPLKRYKRDFIDKGLRYIQISEQYVRNAKPNDQSDTSGFLLGASGVYAVAAVLYNDAGYKHESDRCLAEFVSAGKAMLPINYLPYGGDEYLVGRAGYVSGILWLDKMFDEYIIHPNYAVDICKSIYDSGIEYAKKNNSPSPLMYSYYDTEYIGAAHGISTILQMLLSVPDFILKYPETIDPINNAVNFVYSLQERDGNFPCAMDEVGNRVRPSNESLVHWCHGAPGVVYLFAKAYLTLKEEKYKRAAERCRPVIWKKGLLKKGPGLCHGIAGNAYAFLLLYRLTEEVRYLYYAKQFANFMFEDVFKNNSQTPDHPYSLYEGLAGTVCFLADLMDPKKAAFPFLDIFDGF